MGSASCITERLETPWPQRSCFPGVSPFVPKLRHPETDISLQTFSPVTVIIHGKRMKFGNYFV